MRCTSIFSSAALRQSAFRALAAATALLPASASAQWQIYPRDSLVELLDPNQRTIHQARLLADIAGTWFVSARALPYLQRLDTLLRELEAAPDTATRGEVRHLRQQYCYQLGYQRKFRRDFAGALGLFKESMRIAQVRGDSITAMGLMEPIGVLYRALGEPRLALGQFKDLRRRQGRLPSGQRPHAEAALIVEEAGAIIDLGLLDSADAMLRGIDTASAEAHANAWVARARIAMLRNDPRTAVALLLHADRVVQRWHNAWNRIGVLAALARAHRAGGDHMAAAEAAGECLDLAHDLGDEAAECGCLVQRGEARLQLGQARAAEQDLLDALGIASTFGYVGLARNTGDEGSMVQAADMLRRLYYQQGRYREAMELTERWVLLSDSLKRISNRERVVIDALYERLRSDSLEQAITLMQERATHEEALMRYRERQRWFLALASLGLAFLGGVVLMLNKRRRLEKRMAESERMRAQQEKTISEYRLRERIGRDLHDDLGVGLGALKLKTELAQRKAAGTPAMAALDGLAALSDELQASMRQLIWALDSDQSTLADTAAFCLNHARGYLNEHGLRFTIDAPDEWHEMGLLPEQRRNLFLVLKEALHNVVKHARASEVRITLACRGEELHLIIADNGGGFLANGNRRHGQGLQNMERRMRDVGGTFCIRDEGGTTVHVVMPLGNLSAIGGSR